MSTECGQAPSASRAQDRRSAFPPETRPHTANSGEWMDASACMMRHQIVHSVDAGVPGRRLAEPEADGRRSSGAESGKGTPAAMGNGCSENTKSHRPPTRYAIDALVCALRGASGDLFVVAIVLGRRGKPSHHEILECMHIIARAYVLGTFRK